MVKIRNHPSAGFVQAGLVNEENTESWQKALNNQLVDNLAS